jgi:signal transduction histidine kinase
MYDVVRWSQRWLVMAFAGVVVSFVTATTFAELRLAKIDLAVRDIAGHSLPGIQRLASARTTLRQVEQLVNDYVTGEAEGEARSHSDTDRAMGRLRREVMAFGENGESQRVLQDFEASIGRVEARVVARDFAGAHSRLLYDLGPAAQAMDEVLLSQIEAHLEGVYRLAGRIVVIRQRSMWISFALDAVSVLLAVVAAWLTLRTLRRYTNSLELQSGLLSRRADELEEFAGRVAHDVLSPLSTVSLSLDLAERACSSDPSVSRTVQRGRAGLQRVEKIVEGLLQFARAGARPEPDAHAELRDAIDSVIDANRELAAERGVELHVQPFLPHAVACSPGVLDSLVTNLVRNAIKHMGDRPVKRVDVRVVDRGPLTRVEVEDTGPGLPPSLEDAVFEPYVRGAGAHGPGIGLGLATVKRIARAHGGAVGVRSQPGRGSIFWFEIPKATPTAR